MAVSPQSVKELREQTGLPMMECKKALDKTDGDVAKAIEELRKSGVRAQDKLAGRSATDGKIGQYVSDDGKIGVLVALRCETEPVSKNEQFLAVLDELVQAIAKENPADRDALLKTTLASGETVEKAVTELVNQIRENITLGQFARFEADAVVQYVHFDNKKAGMVAIQGASISDEAIAEMGNNLGQHIVFNKTPHLSRDRIDPAIIEKEREICLEAAKSDPKNAKKPEEILQKIIGGQVEKFVAKQCLVEQPYVKDDKQTVEQYVKSHGDGVSLSDFAYIATDLE